MRRLISVLIVLMVSFLLTNDAKASEPTWRQTYSEAIAQEKAGDWDGALQAAKSALKKADYSFGRKSLNAAKSHVLLGDLDASRGKYVSATMHYTNGIAIREVLFGVGHPSSAKAWVCLAELHAGRGKSDQAVDCFRKAITHGQNGDQANEARALAGLADLQMKRGDAEESVAHLSRAVEICDFSQKYQKPMCMLALRCHFNLGEVHMTQRHCLEAANSYKNALSLLESTGNADGFLQHTILTRLGDAYQQAGRNKPADNYHNRALALYNQLKSPIRVFTGLAAVN
ncbi:MAG: tetratricopeptide repeat protein [Desulfomonile tiedjei]|uniref:Tetratricopeptide repeat protein n=1 Tax=Desulfomonile tiedjei TaxID=2358 RepID=A0A9D6UYC3_9BACT|nr:tetratricopeptide repeat protein [Desulfomonile tiedjei]